jgi:hypothetical protein
MGERGNEEDDMERPDVYGNVHKGLRAAIFGAVARAAQTDFAVAAEAGRATAAVRSLLGFLDEHAAHEDAVLMPELARLGPAVHAALEADHARLGGLQGEVGVTLDRIDAAAEAAVRESLGRRLHDRLGRLAAEHVLHMQREEQEASRLLWAHLGDAELAALHGRILGAIPPPRMAGWLEIILPALNGRERAAALAGLRAKLPPRAFGELTAPARAALGEAAWAAAAAGV